MTKIKERKHQGEAKGKSKKRYLQTKKKTAREDQKR